MKCWVYWAFGLLVVGHLGAGLWWLSVFFALLFLLYLAGSTNWGPVARLRKSLWVVVPLVVIGAVGAAVFFKTLVFGVYAIPSGSMEQTLLPGDVVWVNNLAYGPRLPSSPYEVSWLNVLVWLWEGEDADAERRWWPYRRLKGYVAPRRGDVVVFNHPRKGEVFIKRLVALPGDTLQLVSGRLMVNGEEQSLAPGVQFYSRVRLAGKDDLALLRDSLGLRLWAGKEPGVYNGLLTADQMSGLRKFSGVLEAGIDPERPDTAWTVYPKQRALGWTLDDFGPLTLPYKGMEMNLTETNSLVYGRLLSEEGVDLQKDGGRNVHTFLNDYFFVMGDNFHDSEDGRYFGPLREDLLIGRASMVLFSKSPRDGHRIFKGLR